ncbi:nucleoside hydrolase [Microbacterium gorillae]|uniref:nucleoside hydrolase n=1 Tax=Microbacterium gorillae TaxID=1231063 RepID=UPI00058ACD8E|nr:nucleoside hydrolase [Microbacterium gorillae]
MHAIPVIIDCDPGHDDAFALWLALGSDALDVRAVTAVGGNVDLAHTANNARVVLSVAGVSDIPVAAGAAGPLARVLETAEGIHGANGLGGPAVLPEPTFALEERDAQTLFADVLTAAEEPVAIIATGPITNVAILLRDRPDLHERIREIVWMGGSTERGNYTPYAEFNSWVDPEAVDIVVRSGIRFTMVGLNITHQALLTPAVRERIVAIGNETARFSDELMEFFCRTNDEMFGMPDGPLHDPVAVAVLAAPETVTSRHVRMDVELVGTETRGVTSVDLHGVTGREPNVHVAMDLDVDAFWDAVVAAVSRLA